MSEIKRFAIYKIQELMGEIERLTRGGCGKPGHTTCSSDEGTCYCLTCETLAENAALVQALDEATLLHGDWDKTRERDYERLSIASRTLCEKLEKEEWK